MSSFVSRDPTGDAIEKRASVDIAFSTFGCKVNTYDTGLLQRQLSALALNPKATAVTATTAGAAGRTTVTPTALPTGATTTSSGTPASAMMAEQGRKVHIVNTCAVTEEATREAVRTVRRLKKREPETLVVVTGCAAQVDTNAFADLAAADLVVANSHKGEMVELIARALSGDLPQKVYRSNIFRKSDVEAGGSREQEHHRAFLKIQDGCNSFCSYCVIPYARGRSRSLSIDTVIEQISRLEAEGTKEVVLTGIHIGDYQDEERQGDLVDLIADILQRTRIPRIRLGSLEPLELTDRLVDLYADPRLCRHFHMSVQSAHSRILQAMARKYDAAAVEKVLTTIEQKIPGAFVGLDVIVGFPGETEIEYQETWARLAALPWTRIHVFPYSVRPGTKAFAMAGGLRPEDLKQRAAHLRALSSQRFSVHAQRQIGQVKEALIWRKGERGYRGLTRDYWSVELVGSSLPSEERFANREWLVRLVDFHHSQHSRLDGTHLAELVQK